MKLSWTLDDITGNIIDASMKIHRHLGPGLLESVYEELLARELERRGFHVERQKVIRFEYDGIIFEQGLRVDLLVESRVVVELKSIEELARKHSMKVRTYIRLQTSSRPVDQLWRRNSEGRPAAHRQWSRAS